MASEKNLPVGTQRPTTKLKKMFVIQSSTSVEVMEQKLHQELSHSILDGFEVFLPGDCNVFTKDGVQIETVSLLISFSSRTQEDFLNALKSSHFPRDMEILPIKKELVVFVVNFFTDEEEIALHFECPKNGGGGDVLGIRPLQNNTSLVLMDAFDSGMLFQHDHILLQEPFKIRRIKFSELSNSEAKMREKLNRDLKPAEDDKEVLNNKENQSRKGDTVEVEQHKSKSDSGEYINTGNYRKRVEHEAGSRKPKADLQGDDKKDSMAKVGRSNMEGKSLNRDAQQVSDIADDRSSARKDSSYADEDSHPDNNDEDNNMRDSDHQNKRSDVTATNLSLMAFTGEVETQEHTCVVEENKSDEEADEEDGVKSVKPRRLPALTKQKTGTQHKSRRKVSPPCADQDTANMPQGQARKPASAPDEGPTTMFLRRESSESSSCNDDNDPSAVAFNTARSDAHSEDKDRTGMSLVLSRQPRNDSPSMPWSSGKPQSPSPINQNYPSRPDNQLQAIPQQSMGSTLEIVVDSVEKLQLIHKLIENGLIELDKRQLSIKPYAASNSTVLTLSGKAVAINELHDWLCKNMLRKMIYRVDADPKLRGLLFTKKGQDWMKSLIASHGNLIAVVQAANDHPTLVTFDEDSKDQMSNELKHMLCGKVSYCNVKLLDQRWRMEVTKLQDRYTVSITADENERSIFIYGLPKEVIKAVDQVDQIVFEREIAEKRAFGFPSRER